MNSTSQNVLVIGANGFVGRAVVRHLAAAPGLHPVATARRLPGGAMPGVTWKLCDATDPASVAAAAKGCDYAVNCVAGKAETLLAATRNLCAAAEGAGIRRIVHLSSMATYGDATGLIEESHKLAEGGGWYTEAKVACEAIMAGFGGERVILRPGCIHGPGSDQWTYRIGRLLRQHRIGDLGPAGDGVCNLIPNEDVAAAVVAALQRPEAAGEAFNLGDPDPGTWNDYFVRFARAIGAVPVTRISARWLKLEKLLSIPLKAAQIAAGRAKLAALAPEPVPRSLLRLWRQDIQLDHRKADAMLGFRRTPPDEALAAAAAWFKTQK